MKKLTILTFWWPYKEGQTIKVTLYIPLCMMSFWAEINNNPTVAEITQLKSKTLLLCIGSGSALGVKDVRGV